MKEETGTVLWEYDPPRAHPILYAGIIVFTAVGITGSLENLLRENKPSLYLVYWMPLVVTIAILLLLLPSSTRITENGLAPSRPLLARPFRRFIPWSKMAAIYPAYYDVTGAFVSPFASSDGKVTQMGLRIEADGWSETIRFTPTRFEHGGSGRSRGYIEALQLIQQRFEGLGREMVPAANRYTRDQKEQMLAEATKPFLPFLVIVALFAAAAPVLFILANLGVPIPVALPVAMMLPLGTSSFSYYQSRKRNAILNELSKTAHFERQP